MAEILTLVLQHDEQTVQCAVEMAPESGLATKTHVLGILHRLTRGAHRWQGTTGYTDQCTASPASCVMILPAPPSWSFCAASRCTAWPGAVNDLIDQGAPGFEAAVPILSQLLKAEMAEREVRSIAYQIKAARFHAYKDLAGFDFASSEVNEALVRGLHHGEFIDGADNVVLTGGLGTGKTHHCNILETGNVSFRFRASFAAPKA